MIMKKTIKSLLALAAVAFTFAACSDVPEPYPAPGSTPKEEIGDGTEEDPLTVSKAIKKGSSTGAFVKGYIVGYIWGTKADVGAVFGASDTATVASNILFAESADETSVSKCMPVQLPVGAVRTALNLKDNKGMYKKEVTLYGTIEKYFGNTGMKQVSYAIADGQTYGTKPGEPEPEGEVQTVTIAEFNAASVSTANWYQLTGTIKNLKDGDQYGNFDIEDATGSVYVYGLLSEKGGQSKKFQELVAAKGIANGKKITIIGKRGEHNSKIEVLDAYFVSIEDGEGGGNPPTSDVGSVDSPKTVAEALAAINALEDGATTDAKWYVKGKVAKVATKADEIGPNTEKKYKDINYYISEDGSESNTIYVYRGKNLNNTDFTSADQLQVGDDVVIYGKLQKYKNTNTGEIVPEMAQGNYLVKTSNANASSGGEGGGSGEGGGGEAASELTNGNFETWADGLPTGWKSASTASSATLEQSTDAHGGSYSCLVKGGATQNKRLAYKELTLEAGTYEFSFWAKATSENVAQTRIGYAIVKNGSIANSDYKYNSTYFNINNTEWTHITNEFTLSEQTVICLLVMNPKANEGKTSGEDMLVDDATLTKK